MFNFIDYLLFTIFKIKYNEKIYFSSLNDGYGIGFM